jgi:hypothetical protein
MAISAKRKWEADNPAKVREVARRSWRKHRVKYQAVVAKRCQQVKARVLTHYGKNGTLQCCWDSCKIVDIDMLTLDHVNNDGCIDPDRPKGSALFYGRIERKGFPPGFQTLCWNHQWKKEIQKRRDRLKPGTLSSLIDEDLQILLFGDIS